MKLPKAHPLAKVIRYLTMLKKNFTLINDEICIYELVDGVKYEIRIKFLDPWIRIVTEIDNLNSFPTEIRYFVLRKLMRLSFNFAEISYSLKPNNEIVTIQDIFKHALSMDVFEEEFNAIPKAIRLYNKEILPLKNLEIGNI